MLCSRLKSILNMQWDLSSKSDQRKCQAILPHDTNSWGFAFMAALNFWCLVVDLYDKSEEEATEETENDGLPQGAWYCSQGLGCSGWQVSPISGDYLVINSTSLTATISHFWRQLSLPLSSAPPPLIITTTIIIITTPLTTIISDFWRHYLYHCHWHHHLHH